MSDKNDESGATATAMFVRNDALYVAHVGDSSVVCDLSLQSFSKYLCSNFKFRYL